MFIGLYNYTTYLTYLNLIFGFLGITLSFYKYLIYASICLLMSGIFDMFDGFVSRFKKDRTLKEKNYGIQIDSLADMISFGVLPVFIGLNLMNNIDNIKIFNIFLSLNQLKFIYFIFGSFYVLASLIRLAYFNVCSFENINLKTNVSFFVGVPVTVSSIVFPFIILIKFLLGKIFIESNYYIIVCNFLIYLFFIILLSFLFVFEKIKFSKPKNIVFFFLITFFSISLIFSLLFLN
ncbi:CDP-alcohol phosphatidyltransferase family protein [Candidatus Phytoplasma palmae]|uniref:CDP-alcohol phosphatidyltransferase family protein n=1 Tax=Candidatus Phytoplasma palmae TaxID=85624 RepID=UPI0039904786